MVDSVCQDCAPRATPVADARRRIQRRAAELELRVRIRCHTFRSTGITAYLEAGVTSENAEAMATHESPRTTKLFDRTGDEITLDEVGLIKIRAAQDLGGWNNWQVSRRMAQLRSSSAVG
jgi:hypothetical protein